MIEIDIAKALSYQVKKEAAERYFGLRKIIEDEIHQLKAKTRELLDQYDLVLATDFLRLYTIIRHKDLIYEFINLLKLTEPPFYDEYLVSSKTIRERLLSKVKSSGLTFLGRLYNKFKYSYYKLFEDNISYEKAYHDFIAQRSILEEDIKNFNENYSICDTLMYFKELDRQDIPSVMAENICYKREELEKKMSFSLPIECYNIPVNFNLPEWDEISSPTKLILKKILSRE